MSAPALSDLRVHKVISKNTFFLLQRKGRRMSQYFAASNFRACGHCSAGNRRAWPGNSGPVIFPRIVQGATRTVGLFLIRLNLPESLRVIA